MKIIDGLLELLFPPRCPFCRRLLAPGEGKLCPRCREELPWLTGPEGEQTGEFFSLCVSPLRYTGDVVGSIHRHKFQGISSYAGAYGEVLSRCVRERLAGQYDLITWAPLSKKRLRRRGYDQAERLARATAEELGEGIVPTLRKERDIPAQSGLTGSAQRRANVMGAYTCIDPERVRGRRILVIDDVITTGATLSECAGRLRMAGAKEVVCATLARAR